MLKPRQRPALLSEMDSDLRRFLRGADSLLERGDAKELMILDLELRHFAFLLLRDLLQLLHLLACFHTFQFAPRRLRCSRGCRDRGPGPPARAADACS